MSRRFGQILAVVMIAVLVTLVAWYQYSGSGLRSSVLEQYGYYGFGSDAVTLKDDLAPNPPDTSVKKGSLVENTYLVPLGSVVILDAVQVPDEVPSLAKRVRWVADESNSVSVDIQDSTSPRTVFVAPEETTKLTFNLQVRKSGSAYRTVGRYIFSVADPLAISADVNKDGIYDFTDLVNLLQNWDSFGSDSTKILALILSRYEGE